MADVVIQNIGPYDWDYALFKDGTINELTGRGVREGGYTFLGTGHPKENITLVPPEHWERLQKQYPQLFDLLQETNKKGLRILPEVPSNYYDAQHFLGIERNRANTLQTEVNQWVAECEKRDTEIERLKKLLEGYGYKE